MAVLTLVAYVAIPIVRAVKNVRKKHDIAAVLYPGDEERQADFREKVASDVLRDNEGLKYGSPEFRTLYRQEMDRLLEEHRARTGTP